MRAIFVGSSPLSYSIYRRPIACYNNWFSVQFDHMHVWIKPRSVVHLSGLVLRTDKLYRDTEIFYSSMLHHQRDTQPAHKTRLFVMEQ